MAGLLASPPPVEQEVDSIDTAEQALRELSWLVYAQATLKAEAEAEIATINERFAENIRPHAERQKQLEENLLKWADKHRDTLLTGRKKSVELRNGKFRWRDGKDSVTRQDGVEAKDAKTLAGELPLPCGVRVDAGEELIVGLQKLVDKIDYFGAISVAVSINTTAATKARKLKQVTDADLEAIGHQFNCGEEYVTVEPAEFVREGQK